MERLLWRVTVIAMVSHCFVAVGYEEVGVEGFRQETLDVRK